MIESREQRRRSTLLHRRKVAIIASVLIVAILSVSLYFVYDYFNTVIPYTDVDGTEYFIKKVDEVYGMYYADGKKLPTETPLGTTDLLYVTEVGTMLDVDELTGEVDVRVIPDLYYHEGEDGEQIDHDYITVFKGISETDIRQIDVYNQLDSYTVCRLSFDTLTVDNTSDFVLKSAPLSAINQDFLSYLTYFAGHPLVTGRIKDARKDADGKYSEYGLVPETRVDSEGNEYEYTPSYYVVTTTAGVKYKLIVGDRLIDGSGYYLQYENNDGELRDTVYVLHPTDMSEVNGTTFENTLLGHSKNYLTPSIIYPATVNDYFDVYDFSINRKEGTAMKEIVNFSYVDIEDRTGTVLGIHPYVFSDDSFKSYNPNYDNIDIMLQCLMDPVVADIAVIGPTNAQKAAYGLMKAVENEDGTLKYVYDSEYLISFRRPVTDSETGEEFEILQNIYVSKQNEDGNFYTFTEIRAPQATDDSLIKGVKINMICEVSEETLGFLLYDTNDWVYPTFMQIGINYVTNLQVSWGDYSADFKVNNYKVDDLSVLDINATDSKGNKYDTFGVLAFTDNGGNKWVIGQQTISVHSADGEELKPASRHYEYNSIGDQVQVLDIDKCAVTAAGDRVYINKDEIIILYADGSSETIMRYHTMLFQKMFAAINSTKIVDEYPLTEEEEAAIINDPAKHLLTIKITDENGTLKTYEFYSVTARKAYIVVDGKGGFYVQSTKVQKIINDIGRFFAKEDIDMDAIK